MTHGPMATRRTYALIAATAALFTIAGACASGDNAVGIHKIRHVNVVDVVGYHGAREIPNYWTYAREFVLQDRMFEPNASWSLPAHLFMVSAWSARCSRPGDPMSCVDALESPDLTPDMAAAAA